METQILDSIDGGQTRIITREERGGTASSSAMLQPGEIVAGYTVKERPPAVRRKFMSVQKTGNSTQSNITTPEKQRRKLSIR
jgi:hypothetical protein